MCTKHISSSQIYIYIYTFPYLVYLVFRIISKELSFTYFTCTYSFTFTQYRLTTLILCITLLFTLYSSWVTLIYNNNNKHFHLISVKLPSVLIENQMESMETVNKWFIGLQFVKAQQANVDLTFDIQSFADNG